jgi:hypothetical protein
VEDLQAAIEALQRARDSKLEELRAIERALESLGASVEPQASKSTEFEDLGITAAAKRYLKREGQPRSTGEIVAALREGGIRTKSKNLVATVYATLTNSRDIGRTKDDKWELLPQKDMNEPATT